MSDVWTVEKLIVMWGGREFQNEIVLGKKEFWDKLLLDWGTMNILVDWERVK